jgi:hypothetical protein
MSIRRPLFTAVVAVVAALLLAGCASNPSSRSGRTPDRIGPRELAQYPELTGLQMIRQFRPLWLNDRRGDMNVLTVEAIENRRGIEVYIDGARQPRGLVHLSDLSTLQIEAMRRLDASEATQRYGVGHTSGAILVTTVRR